MKVLHHSEFLTYCIQSNPQLHGMDIRAVTRS